MHKSGYAALVAALVWAVPAAAANWVHNPGSKNGWIDLDALKRDGTTVRFSALSSEDKPKGAAPKDGVFVQNRVDCATGKYWAVLPAFGPNEIAMNDLAPDAPLRVLVCKK